MAVLSRLMAGVVLRHDTHGSHLHGQKTVDEEKEKSNFRAAGDTLAELFNAGTYDGHPITSRYVERVDEPAQRYPAKSEAWMVTHARYATFLFLSLMCVSTGCS